MKDKKSLQCGNLVLQLPGEAVLVLVLTGLSVAGLLLLPAGAGHLLAAGLVLLTLCLVLATSSRGPSHHHLLVLGLTDVGGAVL